MAKPIRRQTPPPSPPVTTAIEEVAPPSPREIPLWLIAAAIALMVSVFYWVPLTSDQASIQWDAVDVHYSAQKYFADRVMHGELPHWTPYIFSGFPFLADIQTAAWYPLNWPFFVVGIGPKVLQAELALHALLACLGTFLLFSRFVPQKVAALTGAFAYAFCGYFADHSSHLGMFSAASLLPWLLLAFHLALTTAQVIRFTALAGLAGGTIILAGHFQNALYSFAALGLFAIGLVVERPSRLRRAAASLAALLLLAIGLSAIQMLPGWELTQNSLRSSADYSDTQDRILTLGSLPRAAFPIGGEALAQPDPSKPNQTDADFYLYGGILLLPLAALGLRDKTVRVAGLLLVVPTLWYMLGPSFGFYRLGAILPWFHKVRAPIHFWFVTALGLALLAAAGASWLQTRRPGPALPWALLAVVAVDLFYWNSLTNIRAYARQSFNTLYGNKLALAENRVVPSVPSLTRYDAPDLLTVFGPLNHPLDLRLEATYGYNPLELSAYHEYREDMRRNPKLAAGLNVSRILDPKAGAVRPNPDLLPRAYFARSIIPANELRDSRPLLATLDPAQATIAPAGSQAASDGAATVAADGEQAYKIHYKTPSQSLLKLSVPYFPGWTATVDGAPCPIVRADHALIGITVPAGEHDLTVRFHSNYFRLGAAITGITALAILFLAWKRVLLQE